MHNSGGKIPNLHEGGYMLQKCKRYFVFNIAALGIVSFLTGANVSLAADPSASTGQNAPQGQNPQSPQNPQTQPQSPQNPQAQPQSPQSPQQPGQQVHSEKKMAFKVGVCVGQSLAQQGIMLSWPQPGQPMNLDDATKQALKAAVQDCASKLLGSQGSSAGTSGGSSTTVDPQQISSEFSNL